jgi:asparagine synthase (glutamine-hydrolysing)
VYNHIELRSELQARGESFQTASDTEVVLRVLERDGLVGLARLNGQFALAWWQPNKRRLTLVRDRFGVRPLFYALGADGSLTFGSEAKAIFASGEAVPEVDLGGLDDVFTLWGARAPRTVFDGIRQVPPGGVVVWERGTLTAQRRWWDPLAIPPVEERSIGELLADSVRLRLRADVPVGTYLSGGLDSSLVTAIAQRETEGQLRSFSVAFRDDRYDESAHQLAVARAIGTRHRVIEVGGAEIAESFQDVVEHTETPLVRTAPIPLYLLARQVRADGITVVASGEGADELFWGYDLFKEVALRELAQDDPERAEALVDRLYPHLGPGAARRGPAWRRFLLATGASDGLLGSHMTRVEATAAVKALLRPDVAAELGPAPSLERLRAEFPPALAHRDRLQRAAWLELTTLLEPYLLSSQGDRVSMAHGVEGRYPFLDHRVFAFADALPASRKLDGMRDKAVLRDLAVDLLPAEIVNRPKQPYRAPEVDPFFGPDAPAWIEGIVSHAALEETGLWDPTRVDGLLRRCRAGRARGVREGMAVVALISTQLWHRSFIGRGRSRYDAESEKPRVRIDRRKSEEMEATA